MLYILHVLYISMTPDSTSLMMMMMMCEPIEVQLLRFNALQVYSIEVQLSDGWGLLGRA